MNYEIKQLKQGQRIFVPQTVAEAVLVKENQTVITLDKVVNKKIESVNTPEKSGLQVTRIGNNIDISHINQITPNGTVQPLQIEYDQNGHIIGVLPLGKFTVNINNEKLIELNGAVDQVMNFGDDFQKFNDNIIIRWNSYGTT